MSEPIDALYFGWLCAKVIERSSQNYNKLFEILYKTEFVWVIPADSHRAQDGIELRNDFFRITRLPRDRLWEEEPCSIFELLIAFAKRAEFQTDIPARDWFFEFLTNLHLDDYRYVSDSDIPVIEDILYVFIWRQYDRRGFGGLFPMMTTQRDQRKIEIWYQFAEYLEEKRLI